MLIASPSKQVIRGTFSQAPASDQKHHRVVQQLKLELNSLTQNNKFFLKKVNNKLILHDGQSMKID